MRIRARMGIRLRAGSAASWGPPCRGTRRRAGSGFLHGSSQLAGSGGWGGPPLASGRGRLAGSARFRVPARTAQNTHTHRHRHTHTDTHIHTQTHRHTRARARAQPAKTHAHHCPHRALQGTGMKHVLRISVPDLCSTSKHKQCHVACIRLHARVGMQRAARGIRPEAGSAPTRDQRVRKPFPLRLHFATPAHRPGAPSALSRATPFAQTMRTPRPQAPPGRWNGGLLPESNPNARTPTRHSHCRRIKRGARASRGRMRAQVENAFSAMHRMHA